MKTWGMMYGDTKISVENRVSTTKLMVDDKVVDQYEGLSPPAVLNCHLKNGEIVTAVVCSSSFKGRCVIVMDGKIVYNA